MASDLPPDLRAALERISLGVSRRDAAQRAAAISTNYRSGGNSTPIVTAQDALAYAFARMPATYAAIDAALAALSTAMPNFAPRSLLDVGAGPGTAGWAAAEQFASLTEFHLIDANAALRTLALDLFGDSARLRDLHYKRADAMRGLDDAGPADLVVASYMIGELDTGKRAALADLMWRKTGAMLLVIEPGTPAGYRRIIELRTQLIAQGAHVAAPCPHDNACPLRDPDWCHFSRRLPRSRDHMQVKRTELAFEDEKFSYVALSRKPIAARAARVLAPPDVSKVAVTARLCTPEGLVAATIPRRDKSAYANARHWRWGDAMTSD